MSEVRPLDNQLCYTLYATSMAITRLYKPMLDRLGLTYPQYLVLHVLWEADERGVGEIARRLALEPSTITPLVKRLERSGFVERARDQHDERRVDVRLTEKGHKLRFQCGCLADEVVARSGMTLAELKTLNQDVQRLRDALQPPGGG